MQDLSGISWFAQFSVLKWFYFFVYRSTANSTGVFSSVLVEQLLLVCRARLVVVGCHHKGGFSISSCPRSVIS